MTQIKWIINGFDITEDNIESIHYSIIAKDQTHDTEKFCSTNLTELDCELIPSSTSNEDVIIYLKECLGNEQIIALEQEVNNRLEELKEFIR